MGAAATREGRPAQGIPQSLGVVKPLPVPSIPPAHVVLLVRGGDAVRADLPGGAARLYAGSTGISDVLCAGVPVVSDGDFTDARPGRVLRSGTDTR